MSYIPTNVAVDNKDNFQFILKNKKKVQLGKDIYNHLISRKSELEFFDIHGWGKTNLSSKPEFLEEIVDAIRNNLTELGWNHTTSFNGTGLFIYSTDKPPGNCYEDGF